MNDEARLLSQLFKLRAGKSQAKFGREYGIGSGSMVWQYLNGRRPLSLSAATKFGRALGVDIAEFSPRLAELRAQLANEPAKLPDDEIVRVQCVHLQLSGSSSKLIVRPQAPDEVFVALTREWLDSKGLNSAALIATECADDSMAPTLAQGDLIVIDTTDTQPEEASVYAISYEGRVIVRRLFRDDGAWWLGCDNTNSHRFTRKHFVAKHCFILGRVVHRQGEVI